jgi:hypothetical protein
VLHAADARMLLQQLDINWAAAAPTGIPSPDYFAGRFRFALLVPVGGNHTFTVDVDDQVGWPAAAATVACKSAYTVQDDDWTMYCC